MHINNAEINSRIFLFIRIYLRLSSGLAPQGRRACSGLLGEHITKVDTGWYWLRTGFLGAELIAFSH